MFYLCVNKRIIIGELNLLEELDIQVVFYCGYYCTDHQMNQARNLSESYSPVDTVVLFHGGGNFGGYRERDYYKIKVLKLFPYFPAIMFPQSVWFHNEGHLELTMKEYSSHMDFQFFIRDLPSYDFVVKNFLHNKATLVPDSALQMGYIGRFAPPIYDVIWITRKDTEAGDKKGSVKFPANIRVARTDWYDDWKSPKGVDLMEQSYLNTYNGLLFLQRGRVLITDRLHGHILAILSNIPTVIIDNKIKKLSMFRNTWTHGLERVLEATDDEDAVNKAMFLLDKYYSY